MIVVACARRNEENRPKNRLDTNELHIVTRVAGPDPRLDTTARRSARPSLGAANGRAVAAF